MPEVGGIDSDPILSPCRDTVSSVGVIPHTLPFTSSNTAIRVFRHALSLDEHRARFQPNLYQHPTKHQASRGTKPGDMPKRDTEYATRVGIRNGGAHKRTDSEYRKQRRLERQFSDGDPDSDGTTDVLEVWFAGCHCGASLLSPFPHLIVQRILHVLVPSQTSAAAPLRTPSTTRSHASRSAG